MTSKHAYRSARAGSVRTAQSDGEKQPFVPERSRMNTKLVGRPIFVAHMVIDRFVQMNMYEIYMYTRVIVPIRIVYVRVQNLVALLCVFLFNFFFTRVFVTPADLSPSTRKRRL